MHLLVKKSHELRDQGLVIIGAEVQRSSEERIKKITSQAKAQYIDLNKVTDPVEMYTITQGVQGPAKIRGLPSALVFDPSGKLIFQGHPRSDEFIKLIKSELKNVKISKPGKKTKPKKSFLIGSRKWTNHEGKKITASVISLIGEEVTFKFPNGRKVKYQLAKLSEASQTKIKEAAAKQAEKAAVEDE